MHVNVGKSRLMGIQSQSTGSSLGVGAGGGELPVCLGDSCSCGDLYRGLDAGGGALREVIDIDRLGACKDELKILCSDFVFRLGTVGLDGRHGESARDLE